MIKLVAIDLDGTLFDSKKQIHKDNINALQELRKLGYHVVIATGRPTNSVTKVLETLGLDDDKTYIVSFNGALVSHFSSKEVIHNTSIPKVAVDLLYQDCLNFNLDPVAFDDEGTLLAPSENYAFKYENATGKIPSKIVDFAKLKENSFYFKTLAYAKSKEILDDVLDKLNDKLSKDYSLVRTAPYLVEVISKETDKWTGIKTLAKYLNVPLDAIMCIGDAENDLSMIKNSKIGVAMGNAFDSVKQVSDFISLSNDEAGVAYAINKLLLNK